MGLYLTKAPLNGSWFCKRLEKDHPHDPALEAQQQLFPAENALAQTQLNQLLVIVQLYRALGGGWSLHDQQWMAP